MTDFWESPTLEELAQAQNVSPMADIRALFGTWPGEIHDGFEETIDELRHSRTCSRCGTEREEDESRGEGS